MLNWLVFLMFTCYVAMEGAQWYAAAQAADPKGACEESGGTLRCRLCRLLGRTDCTVALESNCPANAAEYRSRFPQFKAKLAERKAQAATWTSFRKDMEAVQRQDAITFCDKFGARLRKALAEIQVKEPCPGEGPNPPGPKEGVSGNTEDVMFMWFRDCSELKSKEIGEEIKRRSSIPGEKTAHLHAVLKEITSINNHLILLLNEFREQTREAAQTRCWLQGVLRDCKS